MIRSSEQVIYFFLFIICITYLKFNSYYPTRTFTCTVDVFSKKLRIRGFRANTSSGIHTSPIFGKVLKARPWSIKCSEDVIIYNGLYPQSTEEIIRKRKVQLHTASFPATNAPDTAVIPTRILTGSARRLTFAAPWTQVKDSAGGSGMTTESAVQKSPE